MLSPSAPPPSPPSPFPPRPSPPSRGGRLLQHLATFSGRPLHEVLQPHASLLHPEGYNGGSAGQGLMQYFERYSREGWVQVDTQDLTPRLVR